MDPHTAPKRLCLPVELRLAIWKLAFIPETIKVDLRVDVSDPDSVGIFYESARRLPLTLSINRESRHETLKVYRPLFENSLYVWRTTLPILHTTKDRHPLFNPEIDAVEFTLPFKYAFPFAGPIGPLEVLRKIVGSSMDSIQNLVIGPWLSDWVNIPGTPTCLVPGNDALFAYFRGLKKLQIMRRGTTMGQLPGITGPEYRESLKHCLNRISQSVPDWEMPELEIITAPSAAMMGPRP